MNARLEIAWQENLVVGNHKAVSLQIPAIIRGVLAHFLPLGKVRNSDLARRVPLFFAVTAPTSSPPVAASTPNLAEAPRHQTGAWKTLPPLSPLTYYRRNIWRVLPVGGAIMISVFLIAAIVTLLNSVDDSIRTNYGSVSRFSIIAPQFAADVQPNVLAQAAKAPGLKQEVTSIPYFVLIQTVFGQMPVPIYGLEQSDMRVIAAATGNTMTQGRYPGVNEPEVALSRAWANNLHLKIGETFVPDNPRLPSLTEPQKLVGIFDGGESIAVTDKSYVIFELPEVVRRPSYMYIPQSRAQTPKLAAYLNSITDHPEDFGLVKTDVQRLRVFTFDGLVNELRKSLAFLYRFLAIADIMVIGAVALLSGFLANIYFEQRLGEFGLLAALGFRRERLARRLIIETGSLVLFSWIIGLGLTAAIFWALDYFYMIPNGLILSKIGQAALLYTLPTPIIVGVASLATVLLRLYRLDPIEIMERR